MIVTFKNLENDWVIKKDIDIIKKHHKAFDLEENMAIAYINSNDTFEIKGDTNTIKNDEAIILVAHGSKCLINGFCPKKICQFLNNIINSRPNNANLYDSPIVLFSCQTGLPYTNLTPFAQDVANGLNKGHTIQVYAPLGKSMLCYEGIAVIEEVHYECEDIIEKEYVEKHKPDGINPETETVMKLLWNDVTKANWGPHEEWGEIDSFTNKYDKCGFGKFESK